MPKEVSMTMQTNPHPSGLLHSPAAQMTLLSLAIIVAIVLSWFYVF